MRPCIERNIGTANRVVIVWNRLMATHVQPLGTDTAPREALQNPGSGMLVTNAQNHQSRIWDAPENPTPQIQADIADLRRLIEGPEHDRRCWVAMLRGRGRDRAPRLITPL